MKTAAPVTIPFKHPGRSVVLLGGVGACDDTRFGGTQYAKVIVGELWGLPPALDMGQGCKDPVNSAPHHAVVKAALSFPQNTALRSTERVRIVFRVPLWSSEENTSPAIRAAMSGSSHCDA